MYNLLKKFPYNLIAIREILKRPNISLCMQTAWCDRSCVFLIKVFMVNVHEAVIRVTSLKMPIFFQVSS